MDDFTLATLQDSRNEWSMQLINILTPLVIEGFNSIFQESWKLCETNDEEEKYLMTFQNFIARIPKWNQEVIHKSANAFYKGAHVATWKTYLHVCMSSN